MEGQKEMKYKAHDQKNLAIYWRDWPQKKNKLIKSIAEAIQGLQ